MFTSKKLLATLSTSGSLATTEGYDPSSDTWSGETPMPTARHAGAAAVINDRIHVIGGSIPGVTNANETYGVGSKTYYIHRKD